MLIQLRRHLRVLAAAVLVSMSAVTGWSALVHELDGHDHETAPAFVVHDESAHAFRSATPSEGERPVHCVLCHWTRTLGLGLQTVSIALSFASETLVAQATDSILLHRVAAVQPPLRAPPARPPLDVLA
jgi:hypothetical protein